MDEIERFYEHLFWQMINSQTRTVSLNDSMPLMTNRTAIKLNERVSELGRSVEESIAMYEREYDRIQKRKEDEAELMAWVKLKQK